ncbi:hypothetical protein, unknown function [Leishmania braziliensis MHOM/BR/75/M2904]|uniref:Uncharacterized protein n=1 Tax=Leishmania braziliensis TaxID=5660 RepID=A4HHY6_LEIBR|nr:hypothetical protein, unknown function [Leishmania braziliensis MHOM/BR/75/M2904]CAJ2476949.1 unnamed protein product [Leishmania braziliensis]CAJ2477469.1 unnamed protein product [Leishmania braziliensis]CAM40192.2 hypothetical protein, unknown function [Leishmania braziliensis MHOM/BR/75/M2904]
MKRALGLVCTLVQAAASAAVIALASVSGTSASSVYGLPYSHQHPRSIGGDSNSNRDVGYQPSPPTPTSKSPLVDDVWPNVTLRFFIIFMSVCAGAGVAALITILCAYCREYKLLETSDDSDTESVCSCTNIQVSLSGHSDSSSDEVQTYATHRQQHIPSPATANEAMTPITCKEEEEFIDLPEVVIQTDTQSNESHELFVLPEATSSWSDDALTVTQSTDSRLSLACSRRGFYRKVRCHGTQGR